MRTKMTFRASSLAIAGLLIASFVQAQETGPAAAVPRPAAIDSDASAIDVARARITELERRVAELETALAAKDQPAPPAALTASPAESSYAFDPKGDEYRFLNLGVRKPYIAAERGRLIDQLHTMIPPIYEPAFSPFHGYTLPPRAFRVSLDADRFINNHDFGRDKQYALFFDNVKVENQHVDLNVFYGLDHNDTLRVVVPLHSTIISGDGKAFRIKPMIMTMTGTGFGIGDVQLMLKRKWFDQSERAFNFATVVGIQLPTGQNDRRFNDAQTIFMNGMAMPVSGAAGGPRVDLFSDDLRIPNSAQPGTGSWGATFGMMATRQLTWNGFRGALHGGVLYKAMKNTAEGVRPGNELVFAASYVRPPFASERITFDLTVLGRSKQSELYPGSIMHPEADKNGMPIMNPDGTLKMFVTPRPPFEHGTVVFVSPSFVLIPKPSLRLTVSPLIRAYEPARGPTPAFRLIFGATTTF